MPRYHSRNLLILFVIAIVFHGVLIPYTVESTYDAYIHMFFGDHYNRSWFDPWEPRWYTGFAVTSYPPATHMMIGILQNFMSLKVAYSLVMLLGLLILVLGFYRFARIWVSENSAFFATLLLIFASSIAETIHIFGQLPTIFSLGVFLNGMPYIYRWLVFADFKSLIAALFMSGAATACHHVTTIFGSVFFIGPLAAYAWVVYLQKEDLLHRPSSFRGFIRVWLPVFRGIILAIFIVCVVAFTVFPYWYWSFTDPITQVPIPHGSRENFLVRTDLGLVFFLIPWGFTLIFLPYIIYRGFTSNLWPFAASIFLCFILGTGGTTPISRAILRGAFDILTLDRFTFWGSILSLPFLGMLVNQLVYGSLGELIKTRLSPSIRAIFVSGIFLSFTISASLIATLGSVKNLQPERIDPAPIVQFMESDEHYRWRYLTLGFGDQFAYISAQTSALSVDGNYHSARRLPNLTRYSVERLENAKYLGIGGLGSLQQFLINAKEYHLKYIFSNDSFYDPLLYATGWNNIVRLSNNIVIWEKPNIDPLPFALPRRNFTPFERLYWGLIPPLMCFIGFAIIIYASIRLFHGNISNYQSIRPQTETRDKRDLTALLVSSTIMLVVIGLLVTFNTVKSARVSSAPEAVITRYLRHLYMRQFEEAYALLDPETRPDYASFHFARMWNGGLINSYGELRSVDIQLLDDPAKLRDYQVDSQWLTPLGILAQSEEMRMIHRDLNWYIVPTELPAYQTTERIQARSEANFHVVGRRQPRADTDLYKDRPDRPEFSVTDTRLVKYKDRYFVTGMALNTDADPLFLSINGELLDEDMNKLLQSAAGTTTPFRLLPAESSGFRMDFEGRLSIQDAQKYDGFDPEIYLPPMYAAPPRRAYLGLSSQIIDKGLYRHIMLADIDFDTQDGLEIAGRVVNNGLEVLTTSKIIVTLYGQDGKVLWVDNGFVEEVLRPGQTSKFQIKVPNAEDIEVIYDIDESLIDMNLNLKNELEGMPDATQGTIPLPPESGYKSLRFYVDPQIYEAVF